ncbi:hypothetical protein [Hydrogenophaga sp.]|uniref:hypothetical protein n=1 Tax=Hydrogenophaga sp. TaxID=1904254 RepID=UPI0027313E7F|nr:hypothetical protein [Hydrogenophaga sp.]MDP2019221.1 hypothetical protein [Hydrogenophaga sp.]MDP3167949.1 hypothetical protein [Hydrogenophaga sp.]MDP3809800.1 hypothetical protein [Hydrogenophaga sp.]
MNTRISIAVCALMALAACSSQPPAPNWPAEAQGSSERATEAWLSGDSRIEAAEFNRARAEVARTGQVALVARLELLRCATRVASLVVQPCIGFDALAQDAAPAELAYARYLAGTAQAADAALLPEVHRSLVGNAAPEAALASIKDPLSQLVAAGVLFRSGRATPGVITLAVNTASARGWRRPLLAWLQVQQQRATAAGDAAAASALQRRIDLVLPPR